MNKLNHIVHLVGLCLPILFFFVFAELVCLMIAPVSLAQQPVANQALEAAFESMMRDPGNPGKTLRYADLALDAGETDEAIAALERLLRLDPTLDVIRLNLGIAYFQRGSYDVALPYLRQAIQAPDIPPETRAEAEQLIARAEAARSPHQLAGSVFLGLHYDTNVNLGPASREVLAPVPGGVAIGLLRPEDTEDDDGSGVGAFSLQHVLDFERQNASRLETNLFGYGIRYFDRSDFNLAFVVADSGPWLDLGSSFELRPYATGTYMALEDRTYLTQYGGGLGLRYTVSPALLLELTGQARGQSFTNSARRPFASEQSGTEIQTIVRAEYRLNDAQTAGLVARYIRDAADTSWEANHGPLLTGYYSLNFAGPFALTPNPWNLSFSASYWHIDYDAPNPFVDPLTSRVDDQFRLLVGGTVTLLDRLSLAIQFEYTDNSSNLRNYEYDNKAVSVGLMWEF